MVIESIGKLVQDRPLFSIAPSATVQQACDLLNDENIGALAVVENKSLVGIVSARDVVRRALGKRRRPEALQVSEVMTPNPQTVPVTASLATAMQVLIKGGFRHLPVMDTGRVVGMLSRRDIPTEYRVMFERYKSALGAFHATA